jgi:hypothetical protein
MSKRKRRHAPPVPVLPAPPNTVRRMGWFGLVDHETEFSIRRREAWKRMLSRWSQARPAEREAMAATYRAEYEGRCE